MRVRFALALIFGAMVLGLASRAPAQSYNTYEKDILQACFAEVEIGMQKMRRDGRQVGTHRQAEDFMFYGFFGNLKAWKREQLPGLLRDYSRPEYSPGYTYEAHICAFKRRMLQLDNPSIIGTAGAGAGHAAPKPPPPPKPMISAQTAKDYNAENAIMREYNVVAAQHPAITGCPAQVDVRNPNPCWRRKYERAYILSEAMRRSIEAHKTGVSAQFYAEVSASAKTAHDTAVANCAKIASTAYPCTIPRLAHGGGAEVPPLRATVALEAHNPANEASDCLELVPHADFVRRGIKSNAGAAFLNRCTFPVQTRWCFGSRCARGYDNLGTVQARTHLPVSLDGQGDEGRIDARWAGCRNGFVNRPDFAGTIQYACK